LLFITLSQQFFPCTLLRAFITRYSHKRNSAANPLTIASFIFEKLPPLFEDFLIVGIYIKLRVSNPRMSKGWTRAAQPLLTRGLLTHPIGFRHYRFIYV
jgi:hypothetical protein